MTNDPSISRSEILNNDAFIEDFWPWTRNSNSFQPLIKSFWAFPLKRYFIFITPLSWESKAVIAYCCQKMHDFPLTHFGNELMAWVYYYRWLQYSSRTVINSNQDDPKHADLKGEGALVRKIEVGALWVALHLSWRTYFPFWKVHG